MADVGATEPPLEDAVDPLDEDGEWDEDENYDDDDLDGETEEMAQRLREQLMADINRVNAAAAAVTPPALPLPAPPPTVSLSRKEEAILGTMRSILAFLDKDTLGRSTLESTILSGVQGDNVFHILQATVATGRVPKGIAMPLHHSLMSLARSEALFGKLRHSDASSIQLDIGKRKRAEEDEGIQADARPLKRPFVQYDLNAHVIEAVGVVSHAIASSTTPTLEPALIASVQLQLHHIFLFSVTSAPRAGGNGMNALQEIGGLIQVLGVLSGIQIGQNSPTQSTGPTSSPFHGIGTAVYPCPACPKTFSRLYSLRSHQRIHGVERPFRCEHCPASFARNHDLKRHAKLHDKKAWKCSGCDKIFSRRDAIKRHQNVSRNHGTKGEACIKAMVIEVENEDDEDSAREEKRAKLWNGIATSHSSGSAGETEEGEIAPSVLSALQTTVLTLHPLLQDHVSNALGANASQTAPHPVDAAGSQATLASVIARAQQQNGDSAAPPQTTAQPTTVPSSTTTPTSLPAVVNEDGENVSVNDAQPHSLSMFGLSDAQTQMLEQAIAGAALAAQAQAEAEAALEEEDDDEDFDDDGEYDEDNGEDLELVSIPPPP